MDRALREHPFLRSVDRETQALLIPTFRWRPFVTGEMLIREGADDRDLFLVLKGTLDVWAREGDRRFRVAQLGPGSMVGEMAFFDADCPRAADVVATSDGDLAALELETYQQLCASGDPAAGALEKAVLAALAERMLETDATLAHLLDQNRSGGLFAALARMFRRRP
jgi:CRP-like cAMP-binding protein